MTRSFMSKVQEVQDKIWKMLWRAIYGEQIWANFIRLKWKMGFVNVTDNEGLKNALETKH